MEPDSSLPQSQVPAACSYPKPARSSPYPTSYFLKIYLNIILPSTTASPKWSLSLMFPHQKPCIRLSSPPYALHVPPISLYTYIYTHTDMRFKMFRVQNTKSHIRKYNITLVFITIWFGTDIRILTLLSVLFCCFSVKLKFPFKHHSYLQFKISTSFDHKKEHDLGFCIQTVDLYVCLCILRRGYPGWGFSVLFPQL